jgi:hypothetical protein
MTSILAKTNIEILYECQVHSNIFLVVFKIIPRTDTENIAQIQYHMDFTNSGNNRVTQKLVHFLSFLAQHPILP